MFRRMASRPVMSSASSPSVGKTSQLCLGPLEWHRPVVREAVHDVIDDSAVSGVKNVARSNIKAGTVIFQEGGPIHNQPCMHSIQVGVTQHCAIQGEGRFTSHSFNPNMMVRIVEMTSHPVDFIAVRDIAEGESLTFDYTTTEWEMNSGFNDAETGMTCRGFRHLPFERRIRLLEQGLLAKHILDLWLKESIGDVSSNQTQTSYLTR
jgi:hypothetical protein